MLPTTCGIAAAADVPAVPLTRIDHNSASGIARAAIETRTSTIIIGWDARRSTRAFIFGSLLDQLLASTQQHVYVAKLGHPIEHDAATDLHRSRRQ